MFVHKNLVQKSDIIRKNSLLKGLTMFLLGASAVLLFSSADLILNPYVSNSFVYLQNLFLSPTGTSNSAATISFDGESGSIAASSITTTDLTTTNMTASVFTANVALINTKVNATSFCELSGANCFSAPEIGSLSDDVLGLSGGILEVSEDVSSLSGRIEELEDLIDALSGAIADINTESTTGGEEPQNG